MTQLTHQQAQEYLQAAADHLLKADDKAALDSHLETCTLCQTYAQELNQLGTALRQAMNNHWNVNPRPLSLTHLLDAVNPKRIRRTLAYIGAPILVVAILSFALIWAQWIGSPDQAATTPLPTPTAVTAPKPSTQVIDTTAISECPQVTYQVQPGDTLDSIAKEFGIPIGMIMEINGLTAEPETLPTRLTLSLCNPTPSRTPTTTLMFTVTPPILVTTYYP